MTLELLREHRELQYLRAAARERPRRKITQPESRNRRRYADYRWRKFRRVQRERGPARRPKPQRSKP